MLKLTVLLAVTFLLLLAAEARINRCHTAEDKFKKGKQ